MKRALYPLSLARNFQISEPLNGHHEHCNEAALCRCPDRQYDGSDPEIQFAKDWHFSAGLGGLSGGYHQDCANFEPWRAKVLTGSKKGANTLLLDGSGLNKVYASKWFERDLWHPESSANSTGAAMLSEFVFRLSGEEPSEWGIEWRGELDVRVFKNEAWECMGVHFRQGKAIVLFWKDAVEDSRIEDKRMKHEFDVVLRPKVWHRLTLEMTPTLLRSEWKTKILIRRHHVPVLEFETFEGQHPNNVARITQIGLGKEQQRQLSAEGSWMEVARAMCWSVGGVEPYATHR